MAISRWRELRLYLGMDQGEMAKWFNTKQSVISLWETGKRTPPHRQAARKFGVSIDWLEGLSQRRWGDRVMDLGRAYRSELLGLSESQLHTLSSGSPTLRVIHIYNSLQDMASDLVTPPYFARLLGFTPTAFETGNVDKLLVGSLALQRLADFSGIVERWYAMGDLNVLQDPDLDEYYQLVHQMQAEGITPDDIRRVWNAIKTFR